MLNMRALYFVLFLIIFDASCQEEFSFELYFEDAVGNRDTLIVGSDEDGTQGLDTIFGEENISEIPWDSIFEVRASPVILEDDMPPPTFQSKKQIVGKVCPILCTSVFADSENSPALSVNLKANYYPVIVSWDKNKFNEDSCHYGSYIKCIFIIDIPGEHYLREEDSMYVGESCFESSPKYYTDENDTIINFLLEFCSERTGSVKAFNKEKQIIMSPNPSNDFISIHLSNTLIKGVSVHSLTGKELINSSVESFETVEKVDISSLSPGSYIVYINTNEGYYSRRLIVK